MHTHSLNRLITMTAVLAGLAIAGVSLSLGAAVTMSDRGGTAERMTDVLEDAKDAYREGASVALDLRAQQRLAEDSGRRLRELEARKIELRKIIVAKLASLQGMENNADALVQREERSHAAEREERERLVEFIRQAHARGVTLDSGPVVGRALARRLFGMSLGESVQEDLRQVAIARAQAQLLVAIQQSREAAAMAQDALQVSAGSLQREVKGLLAERDQVLKEYRQVSRIYAVAQANLELSEERLADIQAETAAVQAEVLRMQGELQRIDTRLRVQAERDLIQMGLREARPDRFDQPSIGPITFAWPARGAISAGFLNESYRKYFGVPHKGIDIVVPQGSDVMSAADGIVFLARDGGLKGFSYILIGHRDGYATLYGHLSSFAVANGQVVKKGQVVGLSGGAPGTHGAGPMTTGAHLHFEMLQNGKHIDPKGELQ